MPPPIFVVGYLHSGTTLLKWVLAVDPRYFTGSGETAFLDRLPTFRAMYPDLSDEVVRAAYCRFCVRVTLFGAAPTLAEVDDGAPVEELGIASETWASILQRTSDLRDHAEIFLRVMDVIAEGAGADSWIEKTPTHQFFIEDILRLLPDARIVEIVRDPRAVLASKRRRRARGRARAAYDPFWDALAWKSAVHHGNLAQQRYPDRILRVRYEDFVRDREAQVRAVCSFTGAEFSPGMLEVGWLNATATYDRESKDVEGITERWRKELPAVDIAVCQLATRGELARLGYERLRLSPWVWVRVPLALLSSFVEFWVRLVRRLREGGPGRFKSLAMNYVRRAEGLFAR